MQQEDLQMPHFSVKASTYGIYMRAVCHHYKTRIKISRIKISVSALLVVGGPVRVKYQRWLGEAPKV